MGQRSGGDPDFPAKTPPGLNLSIGVLCAASTGHLRALAFLWSRVL